MGLIFNNTSTLTEAQRKAAEQMQGVNTDREAFLQQYPNYNFGAEGSWDAPVASAQVTQDVQRAPATNVTGGSGTGAGYAAAPKVLDAAQLASLDSLLGNIDSTREVMKQKALLRRDAFKKEKEEEKTKEQGKYDGKKLSTLQDFGGAKTDTDINVRDTIENLVSSLSTLGLGGSRALMRQVLGAANKSNRKANATQATNNRDLDSAWGDFTVGNENDVKKIEDQYGSEVGEADRQWGQDRQNTLHKKADVYNAADRTAEREAVMREGDALNPYISQAAFVNPSYTGESRQMATPDLASYTQDIAKYDTAAIGNNGGAPTSAGTTQPGNLAIRAIAVNDKDLGVKKKTEGDLGYGA